MYFPYYYFTIFIGSCFLELIIKIIENYMPTYIRSEERPSVREGQIAIARIVQYIFGIIFALLAVRFLFRLLGANPSAPFTQFIYDLTAPLVAPFRGVFPADTVQGNVFDWSILLAMAVYWLVAIAFTRLFTLNRPSRSVRPTATYRTHRRLHTQV